MGGELKLIATPQSYYCTRVQWALKLKGVEYQFVEEDLRNKSPLLLKSNPAYKNVPVILHHGNPLAESLIILEYIDEVWKNKPLLPSDPSEKSTARFWAKFADDKVMYEAWEAFKSEGEKKEKAVKAALESLEIVENKVNEGSKWFSGSEEIGYLDLVYGFIPHWLNAIEEVGGMKLITEERFPSLCEWSQNFINIPIIRQCIPARESLVEYLKGILSYHRSLSAVSN